MDEFKKCTIGHVYESELDDCPYCNGKKLDEALKKLKRKKNIDMPESAMCYDMGPRNLIDDIDFEADEKTKDSKKDEEEKAKKYPSPPPPLCYAPQALEDIESRRKKR